MKPESPAQPCTHEHLDMDGICKRCGGDLRTGIDLSAPAQHEALQLGTCDADDQYPHERDYIAGIPSKNWKPLSTSSQTPPTDEWNQEYPRDNRFHDPLAAQTPPSEMAQEITAKSFAAEWRLKHKLLKDDMNETHWYALMYDFRAALRSSGMDEIVELRKLLEYYQRKLREARPAIKEYKERRGKQHLEGCTYPENPCVCTSLRSSGMGAPPNFDDWWEADGKFYDPDWAEVPWYDKRKSLAEYAWHRARESK